MTIISSQSLNDLDKLIQSGQIEQASETLKKIKLISLSRSQYSYFVQLCWRTGNVDIGLHLLNPYIKNRAVNLSSDEWVEYAMCLCNIGAIHEAQKVLQKKSQDHELFNSYMAFTFIYLWDYEQAIKYLHEAISIVDPKSYAYSVALVNLLASYVAIEKFNEANKLYTKLKTELPEKYQRLHYNLYELYLQLLCAEKRIDEGIDFLNKQYSSATLTGPENVLFLKWKTILQVESGAIDKKELLEVSNIANSHSMWEVARDCETRFAFLTKNPIFLKRVFYGTPWEKFRERIFNKFKNEIDFTMSFDIWLYPNNEASSKEKTEPQFIVDTAEGIIGSLSLKKASLSHRLIRVLASDLYRPHSIGGMFTKLFEDESFDIATSPNRIYRAISELRDLLEVEKIPLEIKQIGHGYKLIPLIGIKIRIPSTINSKKLDFKISNLKSKFKADFTTKEVAEELNFSIKTAQRMINTAIDSGIIEKFKIKTKVRYRWKHTFVK